ncbi:hypothetical protein U5817_17965 [Aromatoleum evansii]|uniref:Lipoprotein n=1 Tax=Aromatoleum evansii TaxID=59406 RepID=A0ABZ1AHU3_AROEV|nr:hypothetical protein U5817_17965 [Aromatoleum evansii]
MRTLVAMLMLGGLVGCASVPDERIAIATDKSNILDKNITEYREGTGKVVFKRDSWPMHAYRIDVYFDGRKLGSIGGGEILTAYLPSGRHLFGTQTVENRPSREIAAEISDKKTTYIHLTLSAWGWGGWDISETSY